jgi:hypothetical protein
MSDAQEAEALRVLIVWYRQHRPHNCFYCGRSLQTRPRRSRSWPHGRPKPNQRTMDHVVPLGLGGANTSWNQVACCHPCNNLKAKRPLESFRNFVAIETHFHGIANGHLKLVGGKFFGEREFEAARAAE